MTRLASIWNVSSLHKMDSLSLYSLTSIRKLEPPLFPFSSFDICLTVQVSSPVPLLPPQSYRHTTTCIREIFLNFNCLSSIFWFWFHFPFSRKSIGLGPAVVRPSPSHKNRCVLFSPDRISLSPLVDTFVDRMSIVIAMETFKNKRRKI